MILLSVASIIALFALVGGPGRPRKLAVPDDQPKSFSLSAWGRFRPTNEAVAEVPAVGSKRARSGEPEVEAAEETANEEPDVVITDFPAQV